MDKRIDLKSKVTGKSQITLPKELCEVLDIENGDQVTFSEENGKIIFDVRKEAQTCFACKGNKLIDNGKECFVCKGTGKLENKIISDIGTLLFHIASTSIKYKIGYSFKSQEYNEKEGTIKYKEIPDFKLFSKEYSENEINKIQDEMQKLIIKNFSPKSLQDNTVFMVPSDCILEEILGSLVTEEARAEVKSWFRYDKTCLQK